MPSEMRIAVVIPVYNVAPYLKRCLNSVCVAAEKLNTIVDLDLKPQPSLEIICVDDGSTDGSGAMLDAYADEVERRGGGGQRTVSSDDVAERIPCLRVIHQPNAGLSAARNAALDLLEKEKSATHVTFIDSDDWIAPNYLAELVRGLADGAEISAVRCVRATEGIVDWSSAGDVRWQTVSPRAYWSVDDNNHSAAWGKLYAIRLFEGIRYPVGKINEDEYTTYRVFFKADKVAFTNGELYAYYVRPNSIMNVQWSTKRLDRLQAWRDQISFFSELGYGELVAKSRKWMTVDLVEAIRYLRESGECARARQLRNELSEQLKLGRTGIREFYLAHKTAHPVWTKFVKCLSALSKPFERRFRYSLVFDTPYALSLYLLRMTEDEIGRTKFYAGVNVDPALIARLPSADVISVFGYRRSYRLRLACLIRNLLVLRWTEIFAQDHLMFASQLICGCRYTYVEDAPRIFSRSRVVRGDYDGRALSRWWRFYDWCTYGSVRYRPMGDNRQCVSRWITDREDLSSELLRGRTVELLDLEALWKRATPAKQRLVLRLLTGRDEPVSASVGQSCEAILLSQPLMVDCGLDEREMRDVYAPALAKYRHLGILVKPHPRDKFPYKRHFPWVKILNTSIPMQILCAMGMRFDVAITVCSTAISALPSETTICWIGTGVHPKIERTCGRQIPPGKFKKVVDDL